MSKFKDFLVEERERVLNELFVKFNELKTLKGVERDKQILRLSMIAELDAANLYEAMIPYTSNRLVKKVLQDVANEEKAHSGEFEYLLEKIDPEYEKFEEEGEEEVKDMEK